MVGVEGKVVVITGAAGGQGLAEAKLFAEHGAKVVMTDVNAEAAAAAAQVIADNGGACISLKHDVATESAWRAVTEKTSATFGAIHILINNAGITSGAKLGNMSIEAWNRTIGVNLTGAMLGMKFCAPVMRDCGGGSIVNVSSVAGLSAHPDIAYTATKWAVRGMTKTAAMELAEWNIRVNSIHPGQISDTSFFNQSSEDRIEAIRNSIPMGRAGSPLECANLALFLASDAAGYITGAEIAIDGGYTAGGLALLRLRFQERLEGKTL